MAPVSGKRVKLIAFKISSVLIGAIYSDNKRALIVKILIYENIDYCASFVLVYMRTFT
jgi:hypothetical protein